MAYKQVLLGDFFKFEKGLGYKGEFLVENSEVALIGMDSHEEGGGYKQGSEKYYSGPFKEEHVAQIGDVIFAGTEQGFGLLGSPLIVPENEEISTYLFSGDVLKAVSLKPDEFSTEYLYNIYRVEKYRRKVAYGDTGTTVRRVSNDNFAEQLVPLPDLKTQESINEVISLIDQQIENNKFLAKNLETLAQSIFRSWFVDFEPVHAKARGEKPFGMDDETAKLFPDSFEESENGLIPNGWQLATVSNVANLLMGQSPPGSSYNLKGEGLPFFQGRTDFGSRYPSRRVFCTHPGRMANIGDVLVSVRAPVGDINQADSKCVIGRGVASIIHKSGSQVYSYCLLKNMKTQFASFNGEGTVFGAINRKDFENLKVVEPNAKTISLFEANLRNTNDFLLCKHQETLKLIQLREVLLANLIGGFTETELLGALN
jgi:type I restriction enzyme S subunit